MLTRYAAFSTLSKTTLTTQRRTSRVVRSKRYQEAELFSNYKVQVRDYVRLKPHIAEHIGEFSPKHDHPDRPASVLVSEEGVIEVDGKTAACDGGGGAQGHPRIFIRLLEDDVPEACNYCGLVFVRKSKK
eukprot:TRINITY_DN1063_c0_g1_i2.p1 TRINITY_DN1063_c0_g1~~TRINITY_DN1063_c0_g1_i2.p1  ORF type:complete len:130 (+),score=30.71 TRINITY_DN1063_c0_g1_i2:134-523(+)